jgi:hypothetical protein
MATTDKNDIKSRMLDAIHGMMLDMLAAIARKTLFPNFLLGTL